MQHPTTPDRFRIFRARSATDFETSGIMAPAELTPTQMEGAVALGEAGYEAGCRVKLLFSLPGMSLAHAWFKSGFPLPRHSHDVDCLYYVLSGSLRIGAEELGPGEGFFVGSDVPYTYTPGDKGVEVLEFRSTSAFGIRLLANNTAFWARAAETVRQRRPVWEIEQPPSAQDGQR